jgi:pyruvate dehydrogenase E2 component (dihydrolipoamide acetyltransferase)
MGVDRSNLVKMTIKMPKIADSTDTVTIVEWGVAPNEQIAMGDTLVKVETDKAIVDVPSPVSGTVVALLVEVDADVVTGTPIVVVESP